MHAYVTANGIEQLGDLPSAWQYPDDFADVELAGRTVSGFPFLEPEVIAAAGWLEVVETDPPAYDDATERLVGAVELVDGVPTRTWSTEELPPPAAPTVEQNNRATLQQRAAAGIAANDAFLALGAPTQAQTLAQVKVLTKECTAIIRLLLNQVDSVAGS